MENHFETPSTMYNGMRVVAIAMEKGGVGKTFMAINLAQRAAHGHMPNVKKKILVIDVDGQQNSSASLLNMVEVEGQAYMDTPVHPEFEEYEKDRLQKLKSRTSIQDIHDYDEEIWDGKSNSMDLYYDNMIIPHPSIYHERIDVLPSPGALVWDLNKVAEKSSSDALERIYKQFYKFFKDPEVQNEYDLVIIDCPPGKNEITVPVLRSCTDLILPTQLEVHGIRGARNMVIEAKNEDKKRTCPMNIVGVVPNLMDGRLNLHKVALETLESDETTSPYLFPCHFHRRSNYNIENLPKTRQKSCIFNDRVCEKEMKLFINEFNKKVFGE